MKQVSFIAQIGQGREIPHTTQPSSNLDQVYNYKLGSFASKQSKLTAYVRPLLELKIGQVYVLLFRYLV